MDDFELFMLNFVKNKLDEFFPKYMAWPNMYTLAWTWYFLFVSSLDDFKWILNDD